MKSVKVIIKKDTDGEYAMFYELDGFVGTSCEDLGYQLSMLGETSNKSANVNSYELEVPVPNQIKG